MRASYYEQKINYTWPNLSGIKYQCNTKSTERFTATRRSWEAEKFIEESIKKKCYLVLRNNQEK